MRRASRFILLAAVRCLLAQSPQRETVVVTGSFEPAPLEEIDRVVRVFAAGKEQLLLTNSFIDFLRLDTSLDVQARGANGTQSDLSIRGSGFGQTLVLLNGMRLNDPQSGHHNLDIPLPLDASSRIEVLKGTGSAYYGSDAIGGAVNLITQAPEITEIRLRSAAGNFGVNQESASLSYVLRAFTEQLAFARDFSSGFRADRDYRNLALASITHVTTRLGATDVVLAENDRPFGADQFYGNFNSWERTRGWFASIRQDLGANTEVDFAYRRHTDLFVLYRDRPAVFTNRHAAESYESAVRRHDSVGPNVTISYGLDGYHETVASNNLGYHQRDRGAGYFAIDIRALRRFSISVGGREEVYTGLRRQFSPTVSMGYWLSEHFKLRASASRAFRLPSFTDLYYHDPANVGSPNLRPESAWGYEAGVDWHATQKLRGELTVFHRRERDVIDYVRASLNDVYRATNFDRLNFTGVEAALISQPFQNHQVEFRYTGLTGAHSAIGGYISKYVFNYPTHSGVVSWQATLPHGIIARTRVDVLQRIAREPYGVWDVYAASTRGHLHPFLQLTNLSATRYVEILGVTTPGRGIVGGVEATFSKK